jgi:PD-(D/E)XK nuclease superfamily
LDCDTYGMSSLFSNLWQHCSKEAKPRENFFSDIVAELFKTHPEFLFKWLDALEVDLIRGTDPEILFQEFFRSENDEQGFYDIFIRLRHGTGEHLIVVESKIDAAARYGQLQKYQDDLTRRLKREPSLGATLIYVTRDFENPVPPDGDAQFVPTRWERFLQILEKFSETRPSWLAAQVKAFMKEHRIAIPVEVTPVLLDGFLNFRTCLKMFDAVLDSELKEEFNKLGGRLMVSPNQRFESLKKEWIYGLRTHHGNWQVGFHLGFWRGDPLPGVVYAGGYICFNLKDPKAQAEALARAAKYLGTADKWKRYLNEYAVHLGFVWANPIPQPNNAAILRGVLQPVLNSMQDFRQTFDFPWEAQTFEQDALPGKTN